MPCMAPLPEHYRVVVRVTLAYNQFSMYTYHMTFHIELVHLGDNQMRIFIVGAFDRCYHGNSVLFMFILWMNFSLGKNP